MNRNYLLFFLLFLIPGFSYASGEANLKDLTNTTSALIALIIFISAYCLVIAEEFLHLRKSKPVIVAAGLIWILVAYAYITHDDIYTAEIMVRHNILEFAELMLFLLAAMTYINTLEERNVFAALRVWLVGKGYSFKGIFWITGVLAFFISPIADNLTTALLMAAVVTAVGAGNNKFIAIACINIVVAANAGGAFSPFGDITTLMVWQKGIVEFTQFFDLFLPSVVNWIVPALIMSFAVPKEQPSAMNISINIKSGGLIIIALFLFTIVLAVSFHNFLHLPPMLGMMTGLGILKIYGYKLRRDEINNPDQISSPVLIHLDNVDDGIKEQLKPRNRPFDIFISMKRAEWDTLLFFYGVILCVGGLGTLGYLGVVSEFMYSDLGPTKANIIVGVLSAIVDNIPVMFAVLTMNPEMELNQWLLVTLTAGVGGSLLSVGSAAGVALMGQARGKYTFFGHLKWTPAIAVGYIASIYVHMWINESYFTGM
ncbi:MAG: sodium:proton antiporter NhaD [Gammaproteobacteria bacterium]|nr:sodium:proton antiporter NhaD [Gammaproteobacteria bacterium]